MNGMLLVNVGVVVLLVLVFVYFYIKDGELERRMGRYERALDELNKDIFKLQKSLKNLPKLDTQELRVDFRKSIDDIYSIIEKDREYVDSKLSALENRLKDSTSFFPSQSTSNIDEKRIISMFRDGWSVENIAKELMLTKSEVEFTLKIADIR